MASTWTLPEPTLSAIVVHRLCSGQAVPATRALLTAADNAVVDAAQRFREVMLALDVAAMAPAAFTTSLCPDKHLKDNYTYRMARDTAVGRVHYDALKARAFGKMCPACGYRLVSSIDHFLPKAHYPLLATTPSNLVPMCGDCNKTKKEFYPSCAQEILLHPYFDDYLDNDTWLKARVVEGAPVVVEFYVDAPVHWDSVQAARANHHFLLYELDLLYTTHAATELSNMRWFLADAYGEPAPDGDLASMGGRGAVEDELYKQWRTRDDNQRNFWQTAFYQALLTNKWFLDGGWRSIGDPR